MSTYGALQQHYIDWRLASRNRRRLKINNEIPQVACLSFIVNRVVTFYMSMYETDVIG